MLGNVGQYRLNIRLDQLVWVPDDEYSAGGEDGVAFSIVFRGLLVDATVEFDDESGDVAVEVDDESVDDLLSTKLLAAHPMGPEIRPEFLLSIGHSLAQVSCHAALFHSVACADDAVQMYA